MMGKRLVGWEGGDGGGKEERCWVGGKRGLGLGSVAPFEVMAEHFNSPSHHEEHWPNNSLFFAFITREICVRHGSILTYTVIYFLISTMGRRVVDHPWEL